MKIKSIFAVAAVAVVVLSLSAVASAQEFTSTYTTLMSNCKTSGGKNGSDPVKVCKGAGDYSLRVYSSAASTHVVAERSKPDASIAVANVGLDFSQGKSPVEWRMADGKPFAIIMRIPKYDAPADGEIRGKEIGESLIVVGLAGNEQITGNLDANQEEANVKARELADSGYKAPPAANKKN